MIDYRCDPETGLCVGSVTLHRVVKTPQTLGEVRDYIEGLSLLVDEMATMGVADSDRVMVYGSLTYLEQASAQWMGVEHEPREA